MTTPNTTARKRIITGFAAVLGTALMAFEAMPAQAAPPPHAPAHGWRRKQQQQNTTTTRRTNYRRRYSPTRLDFDGDGIQNTRDRDMDGDGIPNSRDRDIDGDGILNSRDRYDTNSARWTRDRRGRWVHRNPVQSTFTGVMNRTPAGYYRDRTGRLIRRPATVKRSVFTRRPARPVRRIGDKDRDGIRNRRDRDMDGDGIRNRRDRDKDGDRVRNRNDRFDRNPRRK